MPKRRKTGRKGAEIRTIHIETQAEADALLLRLAALQAAAQRLHAKLSRMTFGSEDPQA